MAVLLVVPQVSVPNVGEIVPTGVTFPIRVSCP